MNWEMYWNYWKIKLAKITLAENKNENKYSSCTVYIVLMIVIFIQVVFTTINNCFGYYNCLWLQRIFLALNLVFTKKQRFGKHVNRRSQTNSH